MKSEKCAPQLSSAHFTSVSWKKHALPCKGSTRRAPAVRCTSRSTSATLCAKFLNTCVRCRGGRLPRAFSRSSSSEEEADALSVSARRFASSPPWKFPNFALTNLASSLRSWRLDTRKSGSMNPLRRLFVTCFAALLFFPPPDLGGIVAEGPTRNARGHLRWTRSRAARRPRTLGRRRSSVATDVLSVTSPRVQVCRTAALAKLDASGGGGTSVRRFSRRRSSRIDRASRVDRAFIERAENRFRGSFSRKALMFQLDCLGDHIGGCLPRRSPFRSRAWHARRPPVDLRERSHHGACLFATRLVRSRPRPVARVGRGPEPPTDDASRLVRGFSHRLPRNPRRAPRRAGGGRRPPSTAERSGRSGCANECEHVRIAFELVLASPSSPTRRVRRVGASRSAFRARARPSDFSSRGRPTRNLSPSPDSRPLTPPLTAHTPVCVHASHAGFEVLGRR